MGIMRIKTIRMRISFHPKNEVQRKHMDRKARTRNYTKVVVQYLACLIEQTHENVQKQDKGLSKRSKGIQRGRLIFRNGWRVGRRIDTSVLLL